MATSIRMPNLGAEATAGRLVAWLCAVGDHVDAEQVIAEVETDKATLEITSSVAGRVTELLVGADTDVPVGASLATIEDD